MNDKNVTISVNNNTNIKHWHDLSYDVREVNKYDNNNNKDDSNIIIANEDLNYVIKFDTACSHNMSGVSDRIKAETYINDKVYVKGFNNDMSEVDKVGKNSDGKYEYFISDMSPELVLLSAHDYCKEGAAVLLPNSGVVLELTNDERNSLEMFIKQFKTNMDLIVKNRTYEVKRNTSMSKCDAVYRVEEAMSNSALKYFNTKVNTSNNEECILAMLLTGLTFNDIYNLVKEGTVLLLFAVNIMGLGLFGYDYFSKFIND